MSELHNCTRCGGITIAVGLCALCASAPAGCAEAVAQLRGLVEFYKNEAAAWREAFEQQRGGKAFDDQQKELAATRAEIQRLRHNVVVSHTAERASDAEP